MLDEGEREGPGWAWELTEILDANRATLLVAVATLGVAVAILGLGSSFAGGVCDPSLVPLEATGRVVGAGLVGTFGMGLGLGVGLGST